MKFCIDHSQFVIEMLEVRGKRLFGGKGSYNLAGTVFNIVGLASARLFANKKLAFHIGSQFQNPRKQIQLSSRF